MKAIKKIMVAVLLSLSMVVSFVPTNVFAAEAVDTWDGTADTSWYVGHEADSEYHITTAEQLAGLAQLVNADPGKTNFSGKNFYLENDLNLSGHEWISIGTYIGGDCPEYSFCGVFDGQSHVISNLYSHESYIEGADESHNLLRNALFGNVYDGEIKNLGVENADIWIDPLDDSAAGKGILVDWLGKSKITNCWTSGSIYSGTKIEKNIGGIVGVTVQGCTISGCYSTATLVGNYTNSTNYYKDPKVVFDTLGGIVGACFDGSLTVTDCWFDGKIEVNSIQATVAGIVGYADTDVTINNCIVITNDIGRDKVEEELNSCWLGYIWDGNAKNNYWPDDDKYDESPLQDETHGLAVKDFKSSSILGSLQTNAGTGVKWVAGINHPTFAWDERNILADYSKVDNAVANAKKIDANLYSNYSIVEDAINAVDHAKSKQEQTTVDSYADAINKAISELKYKDADYTKVNEAKAKVPSDLSLYTEETVKALNDALALVEEGKNIAEQTTVDGYADAINKAISELKYKDADYTKVNEAKAKVPSDLSIYTDETVKALKDALALVEEGKNITEQTTVDGYADAINKAIEGLVKKNISYKVIEGEGETFVKESGKDISIRIDHEYTENVKVEVDDQEVDKVHYKVTKGSTIITFDDMYLNTLAVGTHHVKVTFEDGIATTTLVIKEQTKDDNKKNDSTSNNQETVKPVVKAENKQEVKKVKTGDDENIIGIALLLLGSLVVLTYIRKKKID